MNLPADLRLPALVRHELGEYFAAEWRASPAVPILRCDVILALLRLGHRRDAERLMGREITVCPPAIPPWPPRPVARDRGPTVAKVQSPNPCAEWSDAHRRFALIRAGSTVESLLAKGITKRDLHVWQQRGWMEITP